MKRILLFLFMFIFLLSYVSALECQYKVNESYEEFGKWLYDSDENYFGEPLVLKDFVSEYMNLEGCSPVPSFKIYNQYNFPVKLDISYTLFHPRINTYYPESERKMESEIEIAPYSEERIDSTCLDIGTNQILEESISYTITGEKELILKKGNRQMQREVCKKCGNEICLNDGSACNPLYDNEKCGSGICNIAGFCGHTKIVECPNGKLNCNDWICLESSTKKNGESFTCEWECKSSVGKDGVCKKSSKDIFVFWSVFIVSLLALASISFFVFRRGLSEKEQKKIAGRIDSLNQEIEKKENELKKIERSKLDFEEKKREIQIVKEEIAKETIKLREEKDKLRKERLTPFTNKQGYKVQINEEGYEVLERTGTLFHRWWFEHNKNRKIKTSYEIHHKDFNKRNNDIDNLEEITRQEHREKHYKRYK